MWNLEKQYRRTYSQGRNREADVENGLVRGVGGGRREGGGMNWEIRVDIDTPPLVNI